MHKPFSTVSEQTYEKRNNSIRLDFDNEVPLTSEDYYNLTRLTQTQFDDLMATVGKIKTFIKNIEASALVLRFC